ncbi:MAG: 3'-5' exonuclease domain-containing protein 2 [Prevotella sp.]|nr:3'-5' exonuclease domain-containing protein 2 [Prevotella sp.]
MKKVIYNKFDKRLFSTFSVERFPGRIVVIQTTEEAEEAVDFLLSQSILGVDTETKPSFKKGVASHLVALLQVSTHDICFLFRLNKIGITPAIKRFLEDRQVKKVGLSWHDDLLSLKKREMFTPGFFVDLQDVISDIGVEDKSLQKLYANIFHKKINKRQQLTNWEKSELDDKQKMYAALDAWACIQLYEEIMRLKESGDYELIVLEEPQEETTPDNNSEHV